MIVLILIFSLIGIIVSEVSLFEHIAVTSGAVSASAFCNISATINCEAAIRSSWSEIFGVPLASYGIFFFAMIFLFALATKGRDLLPAALGRDVLFFFSFIGSAFSVFLFLISKFQLKAYCPLCLSTYVINFCILFFAWWAGRKQGFFSGIKRGFLASIRAPLFLSGMLPKDGGRGALKQRLLLWLALALALMLAAVSGEYFTTLIDEQIGQQAGQERPAKGRAEDVAVDKWMTAAVEDLGLSVDSDAFNKDYSIGSANAPIQLVEFSDFECPACRRAYQFLHPLLEEYKDKVFFVYRNFPLDKACNSLIQRDFHKNACYAAEFARCAGEQDKFWAAADYLSNLEAFDSGETWEMVRQRIQKSTLVLGMDAQALEQCMQSDRQNQRILADVKDGMRLKIPGTPTLWVNGKRVSFVSEEVIRKIFEKILASH